MQVKTTIKALKDEISKHIDASQFGTRTRKLSGITFLVGLIFCVKKGTFSYRL